MSLGRPIQRPILSLLCLFVSWKLLLCLVALSSPGPGYDTSTSLFFSDALGASAINSYDIGSSNIWANLVLKLTRWDAIYFTSIANKGYVFEQEWAFGLGLTRTLRVLTRAVTIQSRDALGFLPEASIAIVSANCAHLLSVLLLYRLTQLVFPRESSNRLALTTASLHIVTPAGLFLSAPYAESSFSCLTFLGYLLYILSLRAEQKAQSITRDFYVLSAGLVFGIATTFRSNGILNGILFLYDAALSLASLRRNKDIVRCVRRGLFLGLGALFVGLGLIFPQWEAFREYCPSDLPGLSREARPWCFRTIPSVYTWVQDVYWDVGFLRYWTLSNLPLFLMAAPMLSIMIISAFQALQGTKDSHRLSKHISARELASQSVVQDGIQVSDGIRRRLAIPQLLLAVLALTTYHVQIITRISSGYLVWYWWIALELCRIPPRSCTHTQSWEPTKWIVRWMVIYAVVQGGLFSSFLPPA